MSAGSIELQRRVRVTNKHGLHARPAAEFVKTAARFKSDIFVGKDDLEVNGKSIMGMMMLAAECGSDIIIRANGEDAETAITELVALVERGFGER
jgi:phosphocarrier protein